MPPQSPSTKFVAFGSWLFTIGPFAKSPKSWADTLAIAKAAGYSGIAPGGFGEHVSPERYATASARADLRAEVEALGLRWGTMAPNVWTPDCKWLDNGPDGYVNTIKTYAALAAAIGVPGLRVDTGYSPKDVLASSQADARQKYAALMQQCAQVAADHGLQLYVEAEPSWVMTDTVTGCRQLISAIDRDNVSLLFDLCHMNAIIRSAADPYVSVVAAVDALSGLIGSVHVADNMDGELVSEAGFDHPPTGRHLPLGSGNVPLEAVCARLELEPRIRDNPERTLDLCFFVGEYPQVLIDSSKVMRKLYPTAA